MPKTERKIPRKRKREEPPALPEEPENTSPSLQVEGFESAPAKKSKKSQPTEDNAIVHDTVSEANQDIRRAEVRGIHAEKDASVKGKKNKFKRPKDSAEVTSKLKINGDGEREALNDELSVRQDGTKPVTKGNAEAQDKGNTDDDAQNHDANTKRKHRFIVFVGNLPFNTTTPHLTTHFAKIEPSAIRHITEKDTGRSKGFAFLEFDAYDRMKTCLQLYHHSWFPALAPDEKDKEKEDGEGEVKENKKTAKKKKKGKKGDGELEPRKINVELTSGGGGNSTSRKERLHEKNSKLTGQRRRRDEAKYAQEAEKMMRKGKGPSAKAVKRKLGRENGGNDDPARSKPSMEDNQGIHPSRLARMSKT